MKFEEYEKASALTDLGNQPWYYTLGISGECGEVSEKIKKLYRDNKGKYDQNWVIELEKEIGDVLWYLSRLAAKFDTTLENCAKSNIKKLKSRKKRNKLSGSGDNR